MTILLTGASGFLGKAVLKTAQLRKLNIRPVYRSINLAELQPGGVLVLGQDGSTDWSYALQGVCVVIHVASRAHVMSEDANEALVEYRRVNVQGTLNLARQAAGAGVRRFIFISSIKVNGEATVLHRPFTADDAPDPVDAYSQSKAEAEAQLTQLAQDTEMEVTIIRPPLIYGPGVKGNFASLISWVRRGLPLPLGCVNTNRRSLVGIDNLVDLIILCTYHPNAANQIFLVSDGDDLSTAELLNKISKALGQPSRMLSVPTWLILFLAAMLNKKMVSNRLLGSLQVDIQKTCDLLKWKPYMTVEEGFRRTVKCINVKSI
jgi:nucleoside-diphosphate-sugar epimerase